jgi:hypothetical protein
MNLSNDARAHDDADTQDACGQPEGVTANVIKIDPLKSDGDLIVATLKEAGAATLRKFVLYQPPVAASIGRLFAIRTRASVERSDAGWGASARFAGFNGSHTSLPFVWPDLASPVWSLR